MRRLFAVLVAILLVAAVPAAASAPRWIPKNATFSGGRAITLHTSANGQKLDEIKAYVRGITCQPVDPNGYSDYGRYGFTETLKAKIDSRGRFHVRGRYFVITGRFTNQRITGTVRADFVAFMNGAQDEHCTSDTRSFIAHR